MRHYLGLSAVRFMPAYAAPHKPKPPIADVWHRVAMLALATMDEPAFTISTREVELGRPTYTIETLSLLRAEEPVDTELFFLIGADMYEDIPNWKDFRGILSLAQFAVLSRPGYELGRDHLPEWAKSVVEELKAPLPHVDGGSRRIFICPGREHPANSTGIRERAARGSSLKGMVPAAVANYIRKHRLYMERDDAETHSAAPFDRATGGRSRLHRG